MAQFVHSFAVKPYVRGTLYCRVFVFPTRKSMRDFARATGDPTPKLVAYCEAIRQVWKKSGHRTGLCADIHLCVGWLDVNTISHECVHAAMKVVKRKFPRAWKEDRDRLEETIAYTQGNLVGKILPALQKRGLLAKDHATKRRLRFAESRVLGVAA